MLLKFEQNRAIIASELSRKTMLIQLQTAI